MGVVHVDLIGGGIRRVISQAAREDTDSQDLDRSSRYDDFVGSDREGIGVPLSLVCGPVAGCEPACPTCNQEEVLIRLWGGMCRGGMGQVMIVLVRHRAVAVLS